MGYNKILVPLDGSNISELALREVPRVANAHAHIRLLSIVSDAPLDRLFSLGIGTSPVGTPYIGQFWLDTLQDSLNAEVLERQEYLQKVAEQLRIFGLEVTIDAHLGKPLNGIREALTAGYDLVIMTAHHKALFSKLISASMVNVVFQAADCPLLLISVPN